MQSIRNGYRGLSYLIDLNWDRIFSVTMLMVALALGAWLASQGATLPFIERI